MPHFALFVLRRLLGIAVLVWLATLAAFGLFHAGVPNRAADAQLNVQLGSLADRILTGGTLTAMIVPTFLAALLLLELSAYLNRAGWLWLQSGYVPLTHDPVAWLGRMILPWIAVAATQAGLTARITRSSVLDVLGEDYIRMARAKGVEGRRIFVRHVLRPAIIPVITTAATGFATLLGAAAIVDQTFALNGIGQALLTAVKAGDLMTIMGTVLITVILICLASLAADIAQKILDPQVA